MMRSGFRRRFRGLILLALPLALVACGKRSDGERNLDTLDNELVESNSAAARDPAQFDAIAADAKANCPVSKVLKAEITLTHRLNA